MVGGSRNAVSVIVVGWVLLPLGTSVPTRAPPCHGGLPSLCTLPTIPMARCPGGGEGSSQAPVGVRSRTANQPHAYQRTTHLNLVMYVQLHDTMRIGVGHGAALPDATTARAAILVSTCDGRRKCGL